MRRLKRMNLWWPGEKMGQRDSQGAWDGHVHTAIFKMGNQQGPKLWNSAQCYVSAWIGGCLVENGYVYRLG